mgnify:CR=1 FL=1
MALFRPYERKTEQSGRESHQRTRLVPETGKKTAASPTEKEKKSPEAQETSIPKTETHHTSSHGSSKVKVPRRQPVRKSEPTLTRKQAEAARMQRLHPNLTPKEQRKADREASARQRMESWDKIESSPERVLARDYVDARWTVTEFMFPVMILIMAGTMATAAWPLISLAIGLGLWLMLILSLINTWFMWRGFRRLLARRVPGASPRGLLMYMFNRAMWIRRFRRPAPRINRGETI